MGAGVGPLGAHEAFRIYVYFHDENDGSSLPFDPANTADNTAYGEFLTGLSRVLAMTQQPGSWVPLVEDSVREDSLIKGTPSVDVASPIKGGIILLRAPIQSAPTPREVNCALDRVLEAVRQKKTASGKTRRAKVPANGCVGPATDEWASHHGTGGKGSNHCV